VKAISRQLPEDEGYAVRFVGLNVRRQILDSSASHLPDAFSFAKPVLAAYTHPSAFEVRGQSLSRILAANEEGSRMYKPSRVVLVKARQCQREQGQLPQARRFTPSVTLNCRNALRPLRTEGSPAVVWNTWSTADGHWGKEARWNLFG